MNKTIEELKDEKRYGTAHVYQSTLNAFSEFCGCEVIYFHQLNKANLKEFETYLRDKQLSWNTVSTYMRTLRATYNKAVDKKIITENSRLFHHVYTGVKNDIKRALEVEEINKLLNEVPLKKLPEDLIRCRVWANLMFQLRGMHFVDLAHLHKSDLKGNTLSYRRYKVGIGQMTVSLGSFDWKKEQKATFILKNTGNHPLVIEHVNTSCGCTTVDYPEEPVRPRDSISLQVTYKADHPEHFNKTIIVYCNAESSPLRLKISGTAK